MSFICLAGPAMAALPCHEWMAVNEEPCRHTHKHLSSASLVPLPIPATSLAEFGWRIPGKHSKQSFMGSLNALITNISSRFLADGRLARGIFDVRRAHILSVIARNQILATLRLAWGFLASRAASREGPLQPGRPSFIKRVVPTSISCRP